MIMQKIVRLILCAAVFLQSTSAFETDQFNLPPAPLADIGDEVSAYVAENVKRAVENVNAEIFRRQNCLENKIKSPKCASPEKERAKLVYLQSEEAVALAVYRLLGAGTIPFTKSGSWMETHRFINEPARYKTGFAKSIFFVVPPDYLTVSSTVNLYGANFGTDKIAHFFQQGYEYYKIYKRALAEKSTAEEAARIAVSYGRKTENTFFGTLVSGVFSNADLCANFVGLKFYLNLTGEIKIGSRIIPPLLLLRNRVWKLNGNLNFLRQNLLKPFISNHLNEALNSSIYIPGLRSNVRRVVRKQSCPQWRGRFPDYKRADFDEISQSLKLWNGEDYGFKESRNFVTIANTCFERETAGKIGTE